MYYLYLPVIMAPEASEGLRGYARLPPALHGVMPILEQAMLRENTEHRYWKYAYLSARKGWATPDNPLNRPGWHCDGFGSPDMNYIWWSGAGTRFAVGNFGEISDDLKLSMRQFEARCVTRNYAHEPVRIETPEAKHLYQIDRYVVHATPVLRIGQMRQFVKISFSNERYNLYGNSHNYLFDYDWPMVDREEIRNDTSKAQGDSA